MAAPADPRDALDLEVTDVGGPADAPLLAAFHAGPYLDAFARQREPLDAWARALWGDARAGVRLHVRIAGRHLRDPARRAIAGGITFERYPASGCGLLTYLVVAPPWRRRGLGRRLLDGAIADLAAAGAPVVLGEVVDPDRAPPALAAEARARLARFGRWGARALAIRYVQPALGPGLPRDRSLRLLAFPGAGPAPAAVPGAAVRTWFTELVGATEGPAALADPELAAVAGAIPAEVPLAPAP